MLVYVMFKASATLIGQSSSPVLHSMFIAERQEAALIVLIACFCCCIIENYENNRPNH
jgi:hypothetical protein